MTTAAPAPLATPTAGVRSRLGVAVAVLGLIVATAGCGSDDDAAELSDPSATALELVTEFLNAVDDPDQLEEILSDGFQELRADGKLISREDALSASVEIGDFEIIEPVVATQDGDVLTVTWELAIDETIDGETLQSEPRPRLTVFAWDGDRWQVAGHANFNTPG